MRLLTSLIVLTAAFGAHAQDTLEEKVAAAQAAESRPQSDVKRDRNRMPAETLGFFGMTDDMRVLELMPGGGWYTRILAPVLAENGEFYVAVGASRVSEAIAGSAGFDNINVVETSDNLHRPEGSRFYAMDQFELGLSDLDMVLTFRNLHNFEAKSRAMLNKQVFASLRSGGLYGAVDHTMRHMEAMNGENRRRLDPVLVIKEMLDVGFEFVRYSDLHHRADDELEYEVGRRSVRGNSDRFTMLFRKP
jgi:predicted methyltransferase